MVRIHPDPPIQSRWARRSRSRSRSEGAVAQLGERLLCKQEVIGSIPFSSTKSKEAGIFEASAVSEFTGKPAGLPLIFDRLFFNKTEEVKRRTTEHRRVLGWIVSTRSLSSSEGSGIANTRDAAFSVMGSSD